MAYYREEVIELLKLHQKELGSQTRLARAMGLAQNHLCMIMKGDRGIPKEVLDYLNLAEVTLYVTKDTES